MYIEMTSFAIPTFLIVGAKILAYAVGVYVALVVIVGMFYPGN